MGRMERILYRHRRWNRVKLSDAHGKWVRIKMKSGEVYVGLAYDYTSAFDNEPDPASITIEHVELFEPDIELVEFVE